MKKIIYLLIFAVLLGVVIALLSGLVGNLFTGMIGGSYWGYPFSWISRAFYEPGHYGPMIYDLFALVIDIVIWSLISFGILYITFKKKL